VSDALAAVLRADPPLARVLTFSRRFGRETTVLAMHAALPLGLSPELVHLLRINFVREAPFIAEADLLLSPLCAEVGGGMYEMDADVRELLLAEMARTPGYGPSHVRRVAHFLRVWAGRALDETADPDVREHLRVQQWVAMAYADPARAAEALAGALRTGVESRDRSEVARVARLTTVLSAPLAAQVELRRYAGAVEALAGGATAAAGDDTGEVAVGAARLPGLNRVVRLWDPELDSQETAQQQTDPFGQPLSGPDASQQQEQSADTSDDASAEHGYRVARVLVIGPPQLDKQRLIQSMGTKPFRAVRSGGAHVSRWRAWTGSARGAAHDVVFYEPEPDGGAFDLLAEESAAILLVLSGREDDATVQSWMMTASVGRPAMVVVTGQGTEARVQAFLGIAVRSGVGGPVLWTDGEDVEHVKESIRHMVPWGQFPAADSPEDVDWLERQLKTHFGDLPVADWGEETRYRFSEALRIARAGTDAYTDAALERAVACLQAAGSFRVAGNPPWGVARGEPYERCVTEIWRAATEHHDVFDLPSVPMAWLRDRFSAPEFRGFLEANSTASVLDLVLAELGRRRWVFHVDTRRGPMVVVPSRFSLGSRQTYAPPDEFQPLVRATWAGHPDNSVFVLLLVLLADLGRVDLRTPDLAYVIRDAGMLRVQWSGEEGRMALSIDRARGTRQADFFEQAASVVRDADLVQQLFHDVLERYLPAGTRPQVEEFSDAPDSQPPAEAAEPTRKKAAPRKKTSQSAIPEAEPAAIPVGAFPPEPPEGVNLDRACLVLIPRGRKKVGRRSVDFDALWTHLLEPAILDTRFPDGESLIPVRAWELPKPGTPLPDWTRGARMVVADVTALGLAVLREMRMLPGMRTQTVLLLREAASPMFTDVASMRIFVYEGGTAKELAAQRDRVSAALALALGLETTDAKPADTLIITAESLNVREGPGTQHPTVGVLAKGARVRRLESSPGWYRVQGEDGLTGWISDKFAAPAEDAPEPLKLRVTATSLNLRQGPGKEHPPVETLSRGLVVDEVERSGDWIRVRTPGAREGWVASAYVEAAGTTDPFAPREDDPPWYNHAWMEQGELETAVVGDNPRFVEYQKTVSHSAATDDVPAASAFANWVMRKAGLKGSGEANARSWLKWGQKLDKPRRGCIVVLSRPGDPASGHVGFYVDEEADRVMLLAVTAGNRVTIAPYPRNRVLGYRWPRSPKGQSAR
jgi:uncharacterized protein (TIGR02594 family)